MSEIACAVESLFDGLVEEIQPLWQEQYDEISGYKPDVIRLAPDYVRLRKLEDAGSFVAITCRNHGDLIGYFFWIIMPHLHYRETLTAQGDVYFIRKDFRAMGAGRKMFEFALRACKERKVKRVILGCKVEHDHGPLLESFGFKHFENFYDLIL